MLQRIEQQQNLTLMKLGMVERNNKLRNEVLNQVDINADNLLFQLNHDVDFFPDPKAFYEKEIPFRLEKTARIEMPKYSSHITNRLTDSLTWLESCLQKMGIKHFNLPFMDYTIDNGGCCQNHLDLININRTKLLTRVGTLVTALCLMDFGITALGVSVLLGTTAEQFLLSRCDKSREKIKEVLPDIVSDYSNQMKMHLMESISNPNTMIINSLNEIAL
jgi:hypothetical protein